MGIYVDREGFEWRKSCSGCAFRTNVDPINSTYCSSYKKYLVDKMNSDGSASPFSDYYEASLNDNDCPNYRPTSANFG